MMDRPGSRLSRLACLGALVGAGIFMFGCEDDDESSTDTAAQTAVADVTASDQAPTYFPDGLHPNAEGSLIIAREFNRRIAPVAGGTIVCMGDSITAGGYPGSLGGMTGMSVVDAGRPGEGSPDGAARAAEAIGTPAYVCILYGAIDVISGNSPDSVASNVESIVATARAAGAAPVVGTLTPMSGHYKRYAANARAASSAIRAMAGRTGTPLADLENAF